MKKHLSTIIIIFFLLLGLAIMLYPTVSNYVNTKNASRVVTVYNDALEKASEQQIAEMFAKADDYNRSLAARPSAFYNPSLVEGYSDTLDVTGTGVMGYINIEKIGVELPVYHGTADVVLQIGAGHLEGTSLPVGGKGTHCVLSGHRGLPSAKLFTELDKLEPGDIFTITALNRKLTYEVEQIKTVTPEQTEDLQIVPEKDYCTLLTCTPYGINTHRLLVRGVRLETADEKPGIYVANEAFRIGTIIEASFVGIPMLLVWFVVILFLPKKKSETDDEI